jgi:hypothetical protein
MTQAVQTANQMASPPTPSTKWEEVIEPDEKDLFEAFASEIGEHQQKEVAGETDGILRRGFHAKPHAGLLAEFHVLADLPAYARHGVFSEHKVFPAAVRFSNGDFHVNRDDKREPRGIGIKLVGVPGDKLLEGQRHAVTQDFLATSHSVTSTVRSARQFIAFIRAMREPSKSKVLSTLIREVGVLESARILFALVGTVLLSRVRSMATEHYSGTAPVKFGPYAAKFTVRPAEGIEQPTSPPRNGDENFLRTELADRLRKGDLLFDFLVQFYVDDKRTPIEDTSVRWKPKHAPFVKVAQLRIPGCDLRDPATNALSGKIDRLSFTPWHTTAEHRPLGNVMRARKIAYQKSAALRNHTPEPTGLPL